MPTEVGTQSGFGMFSTCVESDSTAGDLDTSLDDNERRRPVVKLHAERCQSTFFISMTKWIFERWRGF